VDGVARQKIGTDQVAATVGLAGNQARRLIAGPCLSAPDDGNAAF
jgi:hypothetical protein